MFNSSCSKKNNPKNPVEEPDIIVVDPFENYISINSIEDFLAIESGTEDEIKYYVLRADIDLTDLDQPLEELEYIHLEGNQKLLSNFSYDNNQDKVGIFSSLSHSTIQNLSLENIVLNGKNEVGALVGNAIEGVELNHIQVVNAKITGTLYIGGLVGRTANKARVDQVQHIKLDYIQIKESTIKGSVFVGGVVGLFDNAEISNSNTSGELVVLERNAGGIVGGFYHSSSIQDCMSTMSIDASAASKNYTNLMITTGGIVGRIDVDTPSHLIVIKNNFANNTKMIGHPNINSDKVQTNSHTEGHSNYPGFGRVIGAVRVGGDSMFSLENNTASENIQMLLSDKTTSAKINNLSTDDLGFDKRHGETVTVKN